MLSLKIFFFERGTIMPEVNREYKATIFAMLFSDKEKLKSLCEAVSGEKIESVDDITVNTLSDQEGFQSGIFSRLKNDLSFIFDGCQNLYEHQSTWAKSMPVRMLLYYAELLKSEHSNKEFHSSKPLELETPRFIVFYNGTDRSFDSDHKVLKLSEHFIRKEKNPVLELTVHVYNVNKGHNEKLMNACQTLKQYSLFVDRTREAIKETRSNNERVKAMNAAIDSCIEDDILAEFLKENREEIIMKNFLEFDEEAWKEAIHDDGYDEGYSAAEEKYSALLTEKDQELERLRAENARLIASLEESAK